MKKTFKYSLLSLAICLIVSSCVTTEKRHCDSSKKNNKKKMKKLRSNGGFNMSLLNSKNEHSL